MQDGMFKDFMFPILNGAYAPPPPWHDILLRHLLKQLLIRPFPYLQGWCTCVPYVVIIL